MKCFYFCIDNCHIQIVKTFQSVSFIIFLKFIKSSRHLQSSLVEEVST